MLRLSGALLSACFRRCLSFSLLLVLVLAALPASAVHASAPPTVLDQSFITLGGSGSAISATVPVSDLSVTRKRGAKSATACREFFEIYTITNNGPDTAEHVVLGIGITDQFDLVSLKSFPGGESGPFTLKPGESMDIKAVIKVTAFVPGESREGRVSARVFMDSAPGTTLDPNSANDFTESLVWLHGRQVMTCR